MRPPRPAARERRPRLQHERSEVSSASVTPRRCRDLAPALPCSTLALAEEVLFLRVPHTRPDGRALTLRSEQIRAALASPLEARRVEPAAQIAVPGMIPDVRELELVHIQPA